MAVGVFALGLILVLARSPLANQVQVKSPLVGRLAPEVRAESITGQAFDLHSARGHFVVVDFFSSWCVPCRTEQPELVRFAQEDPRQVRLVGIIFNDSIPNIRAFLGGWAGLYPVLADASANKAIDYGVDNPPSKYLIDPRGRIVAKIIGSVTAAELDALIERARQAGA